jgi:YHS domain-containing protein
MPLAVKQIGAKMELLARFVRFVFWVLVLAWVVKLVGKVAGWALRRAFRPDGQAGNGDRAAAASTTSGPSIASRQLLRDPVCGMHLAETLAIPYRDRGELLHFCSTQCRDQYAAGSLRRAANG